MMSHRAAAFAAALTMLLMPPGTNAAESSHLEELTDLSVGSFSTIEQARRDGRYGVAEAEIVRIWAERTDGHWLYQEQALLGESAARLDPAMKEKPYFARVIRSIEVAPGVVERTVHRLKDPSKGLLRSPT